MCGLACHQSLHLIRANKVAAVPLLMRLTDVFTFESHEESCELIESLHKPSSSFVTTEEEKKSMAVTILLHGSGAALNVGCFLSFLALSQPFNGPNGQ